MKEKELEERKPFQSDCVIEDLMGYARKLKALGEVWGTLSWHEGAGHVSSCTLETCGEELGSIIKDYAEAIEILFDEVRESIVDLDKNVVFPLARCQEVYDFIKGTERPEDICAIDFRLNELTDFIHNAATPAVGLKEDFLALRKSIIAKQKKAPDAVSAAAGA